MKLTLALALLALAGCQTCREHPRACAVAAAVGTASLALTLDGDRSRAAHDVQTPTVVCSGGSCR